MIWRILAILLCASTAFAATPKTNGTTAAKVQGLDGKVQGVSGSTSTCTTQSLLLDQSGSISANILDIDDSNDVRGFSVVGNGKKIHSIVFKTGSASQGSSSTYTIRINNTTDLSGTVTDNFSIQTPGATSTEFTGSSSSQPVLSNGTTYYVGLYKSDVAYATRVGLQAITGAANYYYSATGLSSLTASGSTRIWAKVYVCD